LEKNQKIDGFEKAVRGAAFLTFSQYFIWKKTKK
jgi:hypothetical protein